MNLQGKIFFDVNATQDAHGTVFPKSYVKSLLDAQLRMRELENEKMRNLRVVSHECMVKIR